MKIIDVSKHNGTIDWKKVKASGIDGVVIRAGYGRVISQKDPMFESNYKGAKAAGLNVGAYWYSYANSAGDATTEANVFLESIKGKSFELPVYFDIEEASQVELGKSVCTAMVNNFCSAVEKAKYFSGVYSFDSFFSSNLDTDVTNKYSAWVARVENIKPTYCKNYGMHQYSWKGSVPGISGSVDMNDCFKDFPSIIKKAGLNGFSAQESASELFSVTATITGIPSSKADTVAGNCKQIGMTVTVNKQ